MLQFAKVVAQSIQWDSIVNENYEYIEIYIPFCSSRDAFQSSKTLHSLFKWSPQIHVVRMVIRIFVSKRDTQTERVVMSAGNLSYKKTQKKTSWTWTSKINNNSHILFIKI